MATRAKKHTKTNVRTTAKKAESGKPVRTGGTHVDFGLHGLGKIITGIHDAGLGKELGKHLESDGKFVKIDRRSLSGIKKFVKSKPLLAGLAESIGECDCPPDDPGCVYIPG